MYYNLHVKSALNARNRGEAYPRNLNIDYISGEIEAYQRQLQEYGDTMSEANRNSYISVLQEFQRRYEYIKDHK